ncbi:hypothetical protein BRD00_10580 [Halobacteriales archaeon QS_8_69_26]|nr:MAG: hypothetical protein BRD00_10580 [Halobacteriales archaeon QS_8_69_26]
MVGVPFVEFVDGLPAQRRWVVVVPVWVAGGLGAYAVALALSAVAFLALGADPVPLEQLWSPDGSATPPGPLGGALAEPFALFYDAHLVPVQVGWYYDPIDTYAVAGPVYYLFAPLALTAAGYGVAAWTDRLVEIDFGPVRNVVTAATTAATYFYLFVGGAFLGPVAARPTGNLAAMPPTEPVAGLTASFVQSLIVAGIAFPVVFAGLGGLIRAFRGLSSLGPDSIPEE